MPVSSIIWFANLDSIISIFMKILRCLKANKATVNGEMYLNIVWSVFIQKQAKKKHLELNWGQNLWSGKRELQAVLGV